MQWVIPNVCHAENGKLFVDRTLPTVLSSSVDLWDYLIVAIALTLMPVYHHSQGICRLIQRYLVTHVHHTQVQSTPGRLDRAMLIFL